MAAKIESEVNVRNVVMYNEFHETEIRPNDLLDKYLKLLKKEAEGYFASLKLVCVDCPACHSRRKKKAFRKFGLWYSKCSDCGSLFISERPSENDLANFSKASKAMNFYKTEFVKKTTRGRDALIFKPRVQWIADTVDEYFTKPKYFVDIRSSYEAFLKEICSLNLFERRISIEPNIDKSSDCFKKGKFEFSEKPLWQHSLSDIEAVTMFECLDRLFNPADFLKKVESLMAKNGVIFMTTPTISGFDFQVLWDKAKTIFPPDHLNILSVEGVERLLHNSGFEIIELSTPGQLDVELVKKAASERPDLKLPRFVDYMLRARDFRTHQAFQNFLQEQRLSSHLRIAAKKIRSRS